MKAFFSENHISKYNKVLTNEECKYYINKFESTPDNLKNNFSVGDYIAINLDLAEEQILFNVVQSKLQTYKKNHKFLDGIGSYWGLQKNCNLQKYFPGNSYAAEHMEHGPNEYDRIRLLGWMIYLNNVRDGGGTHWPQQKYTSRASAGSLLIWPAGWTHSHYGIVSKTEIKYIITGWCCLI